MCALPDTLTPPRCIRIPPCPPALRNAAVHASRTDLVFLLDVDLLPVRGLSAALSAAFSNPSPRSARAPSLAAEAAAGVVFVVPALEPPPPADASDAAAGAAEAAAARGAAEAAAAVVAGRLLPFHGRCGPSPSTPLPVSASASERK